MDLSIDLWFADNNAEAAVDFYLSVFPNSRIRETARYPQDSMGTPGEVMYIDFELDGQRFGAINGGHGPEFRPNEAVSLVITVSEQAELDRIWHALSAVPEAEQCGWLKDRFGFSWQIVPVRLGQLMSDPDAGVRQRTTEAMLRMKKFDIAALEAAAKA